MSKGAHVNFNDCDFNDYRVAVVLIKNSTVDAFLKIFVKFLGQLVFGIPVDGYLADCDKGELLLKIKL